MTDPTPLSPAAQAVLDAAEPCVAPNECPGLEAAIAAALRAVAERAGQIPTHPVKTDWEKGLVDGASLVYLELLTISFELEAHQ